MRFSTISMLLFTVAASASMYDSELQRREEAEDALMELHIRDALYSMIDPRAAEADPSFKSFFKGLGKKVLGVAKMVIRRRELEARGLEWNDEESEGLNVRDFDEELYAREFYDEDLF